MTLSSFVQGLVMLSLRIVFVTHAASMIWAQLCSGLLLKSIAIDNVVYLRVNLHCVLLYRAVLRISSPLRY